MGGPVSYKVVRLFFSGRRRTIRRGLTLAQAQEHCRSPQASSRTAKGEECERRTRERGAWFEAYEEERK